MKEEQGVTILFKDKVKKRKAVTIKVLTITMMMIIMMKAST